MYIKLLSLFLLGHFVFGDECKKSKRDTEVNTHFWKYYKDLDDTYFFFKNESTSAWTMCCTKFPVSFFSKGNIFDNPILALDSKKKKVYESKPLLLDQIVDTKFVKVIEKIPQKEKGYGFKNADKCLLNEFQEIHKSVSFTAGPSGSLELLTKLVIDYVKLIVGDAKGFYTKEGSVNLNKDKDIIWVVNVVHATGKLLESNPGILEKLRKQKNLKLNLKKILNAKCGFNAIEQLIKDVKKVEKVTKVFGKKSEARPRIIAAIKLFKENDSGSKECDKSPEEVADEILKKCF